MVKRINEFGRLLIGDRNTQFEENLLEKLLKGKRCVEYVDDSRLLGIGTLQV